MKQYIITNPKNNQLKLPCSKHSMYCRSMQLWQSLLSAMVTSGHSDSHIKMGSLHLSTIRQAIVASGHDSMSPAAARLIDEKDQKHLLYGDDDMRQQR